MTTLNLTVDMILVLGILAFAMVLFISNVIRVDAVAFLVLVALGTTQLLPPEQLFSGFSSEAVMSLIAIMIISSGLENAGISVKVARWILNVGREKPYKILGILMMTSGILASFMRSLGTVALFLPIVNRINARTGISKSFLLLPMAFCAILGGMLTMVGTSPLIVLNSLLKNANKYVHSEKMILLHPFKLFDVMPIGIMLLLAGIVYLLLISKKSNLDIKSTSFIGGITKEYFKKTYDKGGDICELKIFADSVFVDRVLKDLEIALPSSLSVIAVMQNNENHFPPLRRIVLKAKSSIAILGPKELIAAFAKEHGLKLLSKLNVFAEILHHVRAGLCEAVIPPSSQFIGQEIRELHMRRNYKLHVLALRRGNKIYHGDELNRLVLRSGDALGMFSQWEALAEFSRHPDFFVLTTTYPKDRVYPKKMPYALFFFFLSIVLVVFGKFPISVGLLVGAFGMIATKVLSIDQVYSTVSWKTVFLLAGLIPLGLVVQTTGTGEWLVTYLKLANWNIPIWGMLTILTVFTTILALIISNVGAAVLMVPLSLDLAISTGNDPRLYALTVALAASNTFIIPTHQVNALVAGPGGYTVKDFIRVGMWMTIIFWIIMLLGLYVFYR